MVLPSFRLSLLLLNYHILLLHIYIYTLLGTKKTLNPSGPQDAGTSPRVVDMKPFFPDRKKTRTKPGTFVTMASWGPGWGKKQQLQLKDVAFMNVFCWAQQ